MYLSPPFKSFYITFLFFVVKETPPPPPFTVYYVLKTTLTGVINIYFHRVLAYIFACMVMY